MAVDGPVALCVLDGWGIRSDPEGNAVALARTPNFDGITASFPTASLETHGEAVGLPPGNIGNSEVGHLHIGAGRTVLMEMRRIDAAIADGEFGRNPAILEFAGRLKSSGGVAHIIGLISDVGVHSLLSHVGETARALDSLGVPATVHAITDGRDSAPGLAPTYLAALKERLPGRVGISTVGGRYHAMDRDRRWDRVELAWRTIVLGTGQRAESAEEAIKASFDGGVSDEFVVPTSIGGYGGMRDGDGLFLVNFRSDRVRQIAAAIADPEFGEFDVSGRPGLATSLGMADYFNPAKDWMPAAFRKRIIRNTLGETVAGAGRRQFRLAETEKFPHVTFFLNGGREKRFEGEDRHMAPSPKVATYDLAPEMAAAEVAGHFAAAAADGYDLIVANFANPDMVGHTGCLEAAITACEAVDHGLGRAIGAIRDAGGALLVTADHGNCEMMIDPENGGPHTAHTTNRVPVTLLGGPPGCRLRSGTLADLAPTLLGLMGLDVPAEMTGRSLILPAG